MPLHGRHVHGRANARMRAARIALLAIMAVLMLAAVLLPLLGGPAIGDTPAPAPYQPR